MSTVNGDNPFDPFSRDSLQGYPIDVFRSLGGWRPSDFIADSFAIASTCIDWKETSAAHVLKADLPGVKKEEVTVEVWEGRVLRISGERTKEKGDKNDKWHLNERGDGKFLRRLRLPDNAKVDQAKAAMKGGVLTLTIPKEVKEPEGKSIEISG